jgi:hypothetical protein
LGCHSQANVFLPFEIITKVRLCRRAPIRVFSFKQVNTGNSSPPDDNHVFVHWPQRDATPMPLREHLDDDGTIIAPQISINLCDLKFAHSAQPLLPPQLLVEMYVSSHAKI